MQNHILALIVSSIERKRYYAIHSIYIKCKLYVINLILFWGKQAQANLPGTPANHNENSSFAKPKFTPVKIPAASHRKLSLLPVAFVWSAGLE